MFTLSKEAIQELQEALIPSCPQCQTKAIFVDQGPHTGKYYYCRGCKLEVEHHDNTYGTTATMKRKTSWTTFTPVQTQFVNINCTKTGCNNCHPIVQRLITPVVLSPGQEVLCVNNHNVPKLNNGQRYKIIGITTNGITVTVGGKVMEYSRCRFQVEVKNETKVA